MKPFNYTKLLIVFLCVLLLYGIIANFVIIDQQRSFLMTMTRQEAEREIDLMAEASYEAILKHDYVTIRSFVTRWGDSHEEYREIRAAAPNGFVIGEIRKPVETGTPVYTVSRTVSHNGTEMMKLQIIGDYTNAEKAVQALRIRLIIGTMLFTSMLGAALWFSMRKMAFIPAEKEFELARKYEKELEEKVQERTSSLQQELAERERIEGELIDRERDIRLLLDSTAEAIYGIDNNGICTFCNGSFLKMLGYQNQEQIVGRNLHGIIHHSRPDGSPYPEQECRIYDAFRKAEKCHVDDEVLWRADGSSFPAEYWAHTIFRGGKVVGAVVTFIDITERRESRRKLEEEKERLSVTLRSIGDAVIVVDAEGRIKLLNKIAEQNTGWSTKEAVGRPLTDVFNIINEKTRERCENPVDKVIKTGLVVSLANHTALIRKDGQEIIIEDSAAPIRDAGSQIVGVVLVFRDVTEKKRQELERIKSQKIESLGVLAGGLAHDFNNLLTSIVGNISIAKMQMDSRHQAFDRLADAENASLRAADLTRQLLTFSKGGAPVKRMAAIQDIIREAVRFTLSGSNVAAEFSIPERVWNVEVDEGQISQVFNNLTLNSVQAMPNGGTITVSLDNVTVADKEVPSLSEGDYVKISMSDTGTGIPDTIIENIFDPYFTTKQSGTGLGLSTVYSIIKKHDGHITAESIQGVGTTFRIFLPASRSGYPPSSPTSTDISRGKGRVLVMDDDEYLRDTTGQMLTILGYEAAFAADGSEALAMYKEYLGTQKSFDYVIMDLTVPGKMGGKEAIQKLVAIDPNVRAIVSSGYSTDPVMAEYAKYGFRGVMPKPYTLSSLSKALREM